MQVSAHACSSECDMNAATRRSIVTLCSLLMLPSWACQRRDLSSRIETLFDGLDQADRPGGFAAAVIEDGQVVFRKAYGYADSEHSIPFTPSTVTDYASVAKQFTGFAVATLVLDGRLRLDDEIRLFLPELRDLGEKVTVGHLLHHTSGLRDWVGLVKLSGRYGGDAITSDFLMKLAVQQTELNFEPGERFQYSNTGYFLLARIVERVTGQAFPQWTREHIFQPLGMNDTHFQDDFRDIVPNRAASYERTDGGRWVNSCNQLESYGSSSLLSTLDDMIKWVANLETRELGSSELWNMMRQPGTLNDGQETGYGFGLSLDRRNGLASIGHGGSWAGNLCQLSYYPEQRIATLLVVNRDPSGFRVDDELMSLLLGREAPPGPGKSRPPERTAGKIAPEVLSEYAGPYLDSGKLMWVERHDDQLVVLFPGAQRVWIHPEARDVFFSKDVDVRISFGRGEDGAVDRMTYRVYGKEYGPLRKVSGRASDFVDAEAFTGDYDCPELRTTYGVVVRDDRLILEHLHNEDVVLQQVGPDTYRGNRWWCTEIRVTRDTGGRVTGFLLDADGNNIRNLRFVRLGPRP